MVGRDRELTRVMLLLDDVLAGGGRLVLCTGEAGIGKTRLAEEAAALAAARGVPVVWARAADRDSLPPYGLWQLVLDEPVIRAAGDDPFGAGLWSRVFSDAERPALADGADSGSAQRFAMFAEVRRRLAEAARPGGLLLVLDDLQWADEASAVLLADVVRQLRGTLILVLATYRESTASGDTSAGLLLRLSADADTERVDLGGLPAGAVGDMLAAAGLSASADQADEVHSETGGNPFLVRELARMLAEQRRGGPVPVPGRVAEATAHRLVQLSDPARALVQTAAVAGNSFSAGVVARILDVPVLALLGPLDECRAAGFLVAGHRPGDHRFSHALVRSAVAARLSAAEQRRLHTAAADAIEALYEGQLELHLTEVARHRVEASLPGDRTEAVAACEAAAGVAAQSLAFEDAVRLYRQALSVGEGRSATTTAPGWSSPWRRPCTAAATCPDRSRRRPQSADGPSAGVTGACWPARRWSWRPPAYRNGTGRSAAFASRPSPGKTFVMICGPGSPRGTRRRWCTAASTTGRDRSAGTRWPLPDRRGTRSRSWTRSRPGNWLAAPPTGWPSGPCWRAGCSRPLTPRAAPGSSCGAGCGGSTPYLRRVS
jgi:hypothetical protein